MKVDLQRRFISAFVTVAALALPLAASAQSDDTSSPQDGQVAPTATATPGMFHHKHSHSHSHKHVLSSGSASMTGSTSGHAMSSGHYKTEEAAQAACPSGTVAWMNTKSHAMHLKGDKYYGNTKNGAYVCK